MEALKAALDLWLDWMRNDSTEFRHLWFPKRALLLSGGWVRNDSAWEDLEDECDSRTILIIDRTINDLPPAHRAALYSSLGLLKVVTVRDPERMCEEAMARIQRVLQAEGIL